MTEVLEVLDGSVGEVLGEVVAVLGRPGLLDEVVVCSQGRSVLVRLAVEEAVEALAPPAERPAVPPGPEMRLLLGGQVPLAHGPGGVAVRDEHLGEQRARPGDASVVAGESGRQLGDAPHPGAVVVAAGQNCLLYTSPSP